MAKPKNKYLYIFFAILFVCLSIFIYRYFDNTRTPSIDSTVLQTTKSVSGYNFVREKDAPEEKHRHGINTGCFPRLPRPIYSQYHNVETKVKLHQMEIPSHALELEKQLVKEANEFLSSYDTAKIPNVNKYRNKCDDEICKLLLDTWERYFNDLAVLMNFINTGNLPSEPNPKIDCSSCKDTEDKCKKYSREVLEETQKIIKNEPYTKVRLHEHTFQENKNCGNCYKVYEAWTLYTMSLMTIADYVSCERKKA